MDSITLIVGVVIGIASVLIAMKSEAVIRRSRARTREQRTVAITDELRRAGWVPPAASLPDPWDRSIDLWPTGI